MKKKKVIKITESQLKKILKSIISEQTNNLNENMMGAGLEGFSTSMGEELQKEDYPEKELQRKKTGFRRSQFEPYPRESDLESLFGPYAADVPPQVYQHLRKNPQQFIDKFREIYGNKFF